MAERLNDIVAVEALAPYRLLLTFEDGTQGEFDVAAHVQLTGIFAPLREPAFFRSVRVDNDLGTIVWPNGADLDPVVLYAEVTRSNDPQ